MKRKAFFRQKAVFLACAGKERGRKGMVLKEVGEEERLCLTRIIREMKKKQNFFKKGKKRRPRKQFRLIWILLYIEKESWTGKSWEFLELIFNSAVI